MNCNHIDDLCSARFDGELQDHEREAFDAHVTDCASCTATWASFQSAVGMLRNITPRETSAELHAATLAAVDGAAAAPGRAPEHRARPLILASLVGAAAASLLLWLVSGFGDQHRADRQATAIVMNQEVVSLQRGDTHTSGGITITRSTSGELSVHALPIAPQVIERVVKVPVDRVVEVPVEVRVEVPVDRIVKVPVEVPRGPLVSLDTTPIATALRFVASDIGRGMQALANASHAEPVRPQPARTQPARTQPARTTGQIARNEPAPLPQSRHGAAVRVLRNDNRLTLETSGSIDEIVPALLAHLTSSDVELQTLVERQLAAIHEQAAADPSISDELAAMPDRSVELADDSALLFGLAEDTTPESPAVAWATWWRANGDLIAQASL